MFIQVNDAGIIVNRMGYPLDARKVCESYNQLYSAVLACKEYMTDAASSDVTGARAMVKIDVALANAG